MSAQARTTPFDGVDLVEGSVHLWAGAEDRETFALRPDHAYVSPGIGRVVVAVALARTAAAGGIDLGERTLLERGRDLGDRGVLESLGEGLRPTWRDLLVIGLTLENREAVSRLCDRLGVRALAQAADALGLGPDALAGYPALPPRICARSGAGAMLRLESAAGPTGFALLLSLLRGGRYRWRVRTRLAEDWEVAASGSCQRGTVEELALWRTRRGWAAAALAFADVEDAWRAEYLMGDGFRRVIEGVGEPVADNGGEGGGGR